MASFYDFFEDTPETRRALYHSFQGQFGASPNRQKYFQQQFEDIQNKFMGLGVNKLMGGEPTPNFEDYLTGYFAPQGGAQQEYAGLSPRMRGSQQGRFAPPARWFA